jgi:hypothetical protein
LLRDPNCQQLEALSSDAVQRWQDRHQHAAELALSDQGPAQAPAGGACPPDGPGRAAPTDGVVMNEPNSQRGTSAVVTMRPHMQRRQPTPLRSSLPGERRTVLEAEPKAQECAKDHRRYEEVVSGSAAEKRSRHVKWGRVRSCAEQKAIGALGQDLLSSSPSLTWVRKTISLPGRSGASRTSRTLNP